MTTTLSKGANVTLSEAAEGGRFEVAVRWRDPDSTADLDVSVLLLGGDGRVRSDDDFVFYNAPSGGGGAVRLLGKRTDDQGNGEDRLILDLESLPADVSGLAIAASLDAEPGVGLGGLASLRLAVVDASGEDIVHFDLTDASNETACVLGEVYRREQAWKCRAVGQGWDSGLAGLATDYGITITADAEPTKDEPPSPDIDSIVDAIADDEPHELDAAPPPAAIAEDTAADRGGATEAAPKSADVSTTARRRSAHGLRTGRKRPGSTLPALTLAGDTSGQPARLFSVIGTGTAQEQERRATSALLATMMAVRDFGRGLTVRFGGPAGTVETYLEVPFVLGETTVYPDGVIRVGRAGKVWTALLETKTGPNRLRREQVENYLEVAKSQGFDAVVTLSNDLVAVGGAHPVEVDRRKLKKVALHHISWSEVLHEARMHVDHRGVEDREQAWVLAELARYLQDPRSGAAGFDDMGADWVPTREAIAAGTIRATDKRIPAVAVSWDKLIRHMCLRLTGQLGVSVAPVLPRKVANDAAARVQASVAGLAAKGLLVATIRVPQAVGHLHVVADIRLGQVRTSVELGAPHEGGSSRRVNWLLRQLKDAPDNLRVEVVFARQTPSTCELLKDVRENNAALLPDSGAEVRAFRLTLSSPLGTKRSGIRGAFIPSVNAGVDAFYAEVVQGLRPHPAAAARLPKDVAEEAAETIGAIEEAGAEETEPAEPPGT